MTPTICTETCGDGIITVSEQCEDHDGGPNSYDGCSSTCQKELYFTCNTLFDDPFPQDFTTCKGVCGDGRLVFGEICDDGTPNDNFGCKPDCTGSLPGFSCTGGSPIAPSTCTEICGDGILTINEDCED